MTSAADPRPPEDIERRIRERGAVLDMPFAMQLYAPLLARQPREGVEVYRDLAYGPHERHRLDVYRHTAPTASPRPVLVFVHGGGFIRGDKRDQENLGLYFARQGFDVVVPNYRLAPQHRWPAGAEDVVAVYEWVRREAAAHGGDPGRIFLSGGSAGAAHVATAVLLRRLQPKEGLAIAGAVLMSGVYNPHLEKLARRQFGIDTPDPRNEAYFGSEASAYPAMSIVKLVDAAPVPMLITCAELDPPQFQVQAGELFAALVGDHGFDCEIAVVRGHAHLTQPFSFNTADESLALPVLRFLQAHLPIHPT